MAFSDQKKGMLIAFTAIMFITPDSLLIRLSNISSWNLIFYRGFIPFLVVFFGLLIIYKTRLLKEIVSNGWHGVFYAARFSASSNFPEAENLTCSQFSKEDISRLLQHDLDYFICAQAPNVREGQRLCESTETVAEE